MDVLRIIAVREKWLWVGGMWGEEVNFLDTRLNSGIVGLDETVEGRGFILLGGTGGFLFHRTKSLANALPEDG